MGHTLILTATHGPVRGTDKQCVPVLNSKSIISSSCLYNTWGVFSCFLGKEMAVYKHNCLLKALCCHIKCDRSTSDLSTYKESVRKKHLLQWIDHSLKVSNEPRNHREGLVLYWDAYSHKDTEIYTGAKVHKEYLKRLLWHPMNPGPYCSHISSS